MNKPIHLGLLILELSKILMYEFWYDCVKPCSFIVYIKIDYIYKDIAEDIKTGFDTSRYELNRPLLKGKSKEVIG